MATEQAVLEALRGVKDPESQKDIVTLGLVRELEIAGGRVSFALAFTSQSPQSRVTIHSMASRLVDIIRSPDPAVRGRMGLDQGEEYVPVYFPGTFDKRSASAIEVRSGTEVKGVDMIVV